MKNYVVKRGYSFVDKKGRAHGEGQILKLDIDDAYNAKQEWKVIELEELRRQLGVTPSDTTVPAKTADALKQTVPEVTDPGKDNDENPAVKIEDLVETLAPLTEPKKTEPKPDVEPVAVDPAKVGSMLDRVNDFVKEQTEKQKEKDK